MLAIILTTSKDPVVIGPILFLGTIVIGGWASRSITRSKFATYLSYGFINVVFGFLGRFIADLLTGNLQYRVNYWTTVYQEQYFNVGLIFIVMSWALAFVTGAFIADFIARLRNPSLRSGTTANRMAATLLSGKSDSRAGSSLAQGIVANVIALAPPFFTLIGTIVSAYLGFLAAAAKH